MGARVERESLKRSHYRSLSRSWNTVTRICPMVLPTSYNQEPPSRGVNHGQRRDIPGGPFTYWNRVELRQWVLELYSRETKEGTMRALDIADCINETCLWSGKLVQAGSLTEYDGHVVGFCNPGCRDKFESAVRCFEEAKASQATR